MSDEQVERSKQTQKERLLEWFEKGQTITFLESWQRLGIARLSDVVFRLKKDLVKQGRTIHTELITVKNQFGDDCGPIAKYRLIERGHLI